MYQIGDERVDITTRVSTLGFSEFKKIQIIDKRREFFYYLKNYVLYTSLHGSDRYSSVLKGVVYY